MNKLGKKLFISISITIVFIFTISLLGTNYFLPKYMIYKTREKVQSVTEQLQVISIEELDDFIDEVEKEEHVTIVYTSIKSTEEAINESLRSQLIKKRVTLNRLWITEDEIMKVRDKGKTNKLYDQEKLKASFFANYTVKGDLLILTGISIAQSHEIIEMLNTFNAYIFGLSMLLVIIIVWILSKAITTPLKELSEVAEDISNLHFKRTDVKTNDEIGDLAQSINRMSATLHDVHQDLIDRNAHLKRFMGDITHELKTPIALVKAYAMGIQDGLDDGTYVDTIIKQTDQLSNLIEELLCFSKMERDRLQKEEFELVPLIQQVIGKYKIGLHSKGIMLKEQYPKHPVLITADAAKMEMVFNNLISNAMKYTNNNQIEVWIEDCGGEVRFTIQNGINEVSEEDIMKLWEPFFVLESSRSKEVSGTGLGLAIVKSILERHSFQYGVSKVENDIRFYVYMKKSL